MHCFRVLTFECCFIQVFVCICYNLRLKLPYFVNAISTTNGNKSTRIPRTMAQRMRKKELELTLTVRWVWVLILRFSCFFFHSLWRSTWIHLYINWTSTKQGKKRVCEKKKWWKILLKIQKKEKWTRNGEKNNSRVVFHSLLAGFGRVFLFRVLLMPVGYGCYLICSHCFSLLSTLLSHLHAISSV